MDVLLKRYKQKYNKVRDDMARWDQCHCRLLSQFGNAVSIIERLPVRRSLLNFLFVINLLLHILIYFFPWFCWSDAYGLQELWYAEMCWWNQWCTYWKTDGFFTEDFFFHERDHVSYFNGYSYFLYD